MPVGFSVPTGEMSVGTTLGVTTNVLTPSSTSQGLRLLGDALLVARAHVRLRDLPRVGYWLAWREQRDHAVEALLSKVSIDG